MYCWNSKSRTLIQAQCTGSLYNGKLLYWNNVGNHYTTLSREKEIRQCSPNMHYDQRCLVSIPFCEHAMEDQFNICLILQKLEAHKKKVKNLCLEKNLNLLSKL